MNRRARHARHRRRENHAVSLFPFLAVLICTMGALILLLVVISHQAKESAERENHERETQTLADQDALEQHHQWRHGVLLDAKDAAKLQLRDADAELSQVENELRQLQERADTLNGALLRLEAQSGEESRQQGQIIADLERIRRDIGVASLELEREREENAKAARPRYAIIPFEGRNTTRRRPIYIECRADGAVLQPEGITILSAADQPFLQSPGNTLGRVLRVVREFHREQSESGVETQTPYPLLLVHPSGITCYYAVREAMDSWEGEFGYELLGEEMDLEFPSANAERKRRVAQVVREMQLHQAQLARTPSMLRALESSTGLPEPRSYTVSATPGGGLVPSGPYGGDSSPSIQAGAPDRGSFADGGYPGTSPGGGALSRDAAPGPFASSGRGGGYDPPYGGVDGPIGSGTQAGTSGGYPYGDSSPASPTRLLSGQYGGGATGTGASTGTGTGHLSNASHASATGAGGMTASGDVQQPRGPSLFGQYASNNSGAGTPATGGSGAMGACPAGASGGSPGAGTPATGSDQPPPLMGLPTASLAESRGKDWGLPDSRQFSGSIARSIHVDCYADRLVITREPGFHRGEEIATPGAMRYAVDFFVDALWRQVDQWGTAGPGMRWRPILEVRVMPDADFRLEELRILLKDSGLTIEAERVPREQPPSREAGRPRSPSNPPSPVSHIS